MRRLLVLVLSMDADPWRMIEDAQRVTWAADSELKGTIRWLYGKARGLERFISRALTKTLDGRYLRAAGPRFARRPVLECGDRLVTSVPEGYILTSAKTIASFRYALAHKDFDFLLRTNTSTYVSLPRVHDLAQSLPEPYYGGFLGEKNGVAYASGTGILLSRDLVEVAVADRAWEYDIVDDVALGRCMLRYGIRPQALPRVNVLNSSDLEQLTEVALRDALFVRCKSSEQDRRHDIEAMHRVHDLITRGVRDTGVTDTWHSRE